MLPNRRTAVAVACAVTVVLAGVSPAAGADTADGSDRPDAVDAALARPDRLDSVADLERLAAATAGTAGVPVGVVVDRNGDAPGGITVERITAEPADVDALTDRLDALPAVVSAAPDGVVGALQGDPAEPQQYGPRQIGARSLPAGSDGRGVTVAVLDTGVAAGHEDLSPPLPDGGPRVLPGRSFLWGDPADGATADVDPHGHGTHVAGIVAAAAGNGVGVAGIAPGARILPVRVLNARGSGYTSDVAAGIRWAHQAGADVINLSLGGPGAVPADMATAIDHVTTDASRGKPPSVVVVSAGNGGAASPAYSPARHPRAVAVAATDRNDAVAAFSSRGDYVDLAAPGAQILSTCRTGGYCTMSGTSMAAPAVAAAAAVLRGQDPGRGPDAITSLLTGTVVDVGTPGWDTAAGHGRIRLDAAVGTPTPPAAGTAPAPAPAPPAAPAPTPVRGTLERTWTERRRIVATGTASDPDGAPAVRLVTSSGGRLTGAADTAVAGDRWLASVDVGPGAHRVCAVGIDQPTGAGVLLGCTDVIIK